MIGEAVDTMFTLGWALLAWIFIAAMLGTLFLLGAVAGVWGAWRWLRARLTGRKPTGGAREGCGGSEAVHGHTDSPDYREAA